jgi:hypothetical protein
MRVLHERMPMIDLHAWLVSLEDYSGAAAI